MKAILTKYHGPTNTRGSRYSAYDGDNRISLSADDALNSEQNHDAAALALCKKLKWGCSRYTTLVRGGLKTGNVYVWDVPSERVTVPLEHVEGAS